MKNLPYLLIAALVAVILLQRSRSNSNTDSPKTDTVTVHDTTYKVVEKVVYKKFPKYISDSSYVNTDPKYIPDTTYNRLKIQFEKLVKEHLVRNIYTDSLHLDSLGLVSIVDTVQFNKLIGRKYHLAYKIPTYTTTTTITKQAPKTRQLYFGGSISFNKSTQDILPSLGLLYKNRRDQIVGVSAAVNSNGLLYYGVQSYWKIKL